MKKLMIAAAIVCAAVASQAGTFKWGTSTDVTLPFALDDIEAGHFASADAREIPTSKASAWKNIVPMVATITLSDGTTTKTTPDIVVGWSSAKVSKSGIVNDLYEIPSGDNETTLHYVIKMEGDYEDDNGTIWHIVSDPIEDDITLTSASLATLSTAAPGGWTITKTGSPIPEPTSGLLLLLGVAGLALRRKHK